MILLEEVGGSFDTFRRGEGQLVCMKKVVVVMTTVLRASGEAVPNFPLNFFSITLIVGTVFLAKPRAWHIIAL